MPYTHSMNRRMISALGAILLALLLGFLAALWPQPREPIYSVAQVADGVRNHPLRWVSRTVQVRGIIMVGGLLGVGPAGAMSRGGLLVDPPSGLGMAAFDVDATGRFRLNTPRTEPALLIRGAVPRPAFPHESIVDTIMEHIAAFSAHPDAYRPDRRVVYRILILAPGHCPSVVAPPCFNAMLR